MTDAIDVLVTYRNGVGVPEENNILFAAPTISNGYLKGWDALSTACKKCSLKKPELMKICGYCIPALGSDSLEWLANHMGHNIAVHRNYYRLQEQNDTGRSNTAAPGGSTQAHVAVKTNKMVQIEHNDADPYNDEDEDDRDPLHCPELSDDEEHSYERKITNIKRAF